MLMENEISIISTTIIKNANYSSEKIYLKLEATDIKI